MKRMLFCALLLGSLCAYADAVPVVRFDTVMGSVNVQLYPAAAPLTVANFLNYVRDGDYVDSFIHRSAWYTTPPAPFVVQGGMSRVVADGNNWTVAAIPTDAAVANEYQVLNTRGTVAMAKLGGNPNSATSQWFFNISDNSSTLGPSNNGGFTVFGQVTGTGMTVVDAMANLPRYNFGDPYGELPLINFDQNAGLNLSNLVIINNVVPLGDTNANGSVDATDLSTLSGYYNQSTSGWDAWKKGDFNLDGKVDVGDLGVFACYYTFPVAGGGSQAMNAPEPVSLVLLGCSAIAILRRRRT